MTNDVAGACPLDGKVRPLRERLHNHLAMMQPHQRQRLTGALLFEATEEIDRLHEWADGFADAQLRERAACEAHIQAMRERLADVAMMLKTCAWALRRGTSPTLGERALVLLTKHGQMGSPLREGTRCTRLSEDGEPCGLEPPCPDCGRACHDVPEGA